MQQPDESTRRKLETGQSPRGCVWLLGAGPGDPDLITWRGVLLLGQADIVLHDALSHPELLDLCPQAEVVDVGKRYGKRATPQAQITKQLIDLARAGKNVVRLKGGDPFMFARGSEEALALAEAEVAFEIVPGVTSSIAASAFAGIPLTHRDASSSVTFITGSDRAGKEWSPEAWKKLATATGTICIYMGMRRIDEIMQAVMDGGRSGDTPVAVVRWGARPNQQTVVGTLQTIAQLSHEAGMASPAIIIIGDVVSLRDKLRWYDNKPLFGRRVLVARPAHQARETARALRGRGALPVVCAAIEVSPPQVLEPLIQAVREAKTYDWVLFTSANGVDAFFDQVDKSGLDARVFGSSRIAVIGPKTKQSLARRGIRADLCAQQFVAESLVADLLALGDPLGRVLIPRAKEAREILPDSLRAANAHVDVVTAYETHAVTGDGALALRKKLEGEVDVVLFTSSSMVDSVVAALGDEAKNLLNSALVVCIGPITAQTARAHGIGIQVEAKVHTVDGALDALEQHLKTQR